MSPLRPNHLTALFRARLHRVAVFAACALALCWPANAPAQSPEGEGGEAESASVSAAELLQVKSVQEELKLANDQLPRIEGILSDLKRQIDEFDRAQQQQLRSMSITERITKGAEFRANLRAKTAELRAAASEQIIQLLDDEQRATLERRMESPPADAAPAAPADTSREREAGERSQEQRSASGGRSTFGRGAATPAASSPAARPATTRSGTSPVASTVTPARPLRDPNVKVVASFSPSSPEELAKFLGALPGNPVGSPTGLNVRTVAQAPTQVPDASNGAAGGTQSAAAPQPAESAPSGVQKVPGNGSSGKLSFNFQNAPWSDVLKMFAEAAGMTLHMRDVPPGDFTYLDRQHYTPTEALDLMNRYLLQQGFIILRNNRDRFLTALNVNGPGGIPSHLVETVALEDLPRYGRYELVRAYLPVRDRDVKKAVEEARAILSKAGSTVLVETSSTIIVTDIAEKVMEIQNVLGIDPVVHNREFTFRRFPLRYIPADEAAQHLRSLFRINTTTNLAAGNDRGGSRGGRSGGGRGSNNNRGGRGWSGGGDDPRAEFIRRMMGMNEGGGGDNRGGNESTTNPPSGTPASRNATVVADLRTNSVLVTATLADMKLAEQILTAIDIRPEEEEGFEGRPVAGQAFLQVYDVTQADPAKVVETLAYLHPSAVLNVDSASKKIHVVATAAQHQEIASQIRLFDGAATGDALTLVPLQGVNGYATMQALKDLYAGETSGAPGVQVDPSGQYLIVKGNAAQALQIESLVRQMAASGAGTYTTGGQQFLVEEDPAISPIVQQMIAEYFPQIQIEEPLQTPASQGITSRNDRLNRQGQRGGASRATAGGAVRRNVQAAGNNRGGAGQAQRGGGGQRGGQAALGRQRAGGGQRGGQAAFGGQRGGGQRGGR